MPTSQTEPRDREKIAAMRMAELDWANAGAAAVGTRPAFKTSRCFMTISPWANISLLCERNVEAFKPIGQLVAVLSAAEPIPARGQHHIAGIHRYLVTTRSAEKSGDRNYLDLLDATADGRHCASRRGKVGFHFRISSCPQDATGFCVLGRCVYAGVPFSNVRCVRCFGAFSPVSIECGGEMSRDGRKTQGAK
jgi:hypothetical protein